MTIVYTKCEKCGKWIVERDMDYFTGIGLVCTECSKKYLKLKGEEK